MTAVNATPQTDKQSIIQVFMLAFDLKRILDFEPDNITDLHQEHQHNKSVVSVSSRIEGEMNLELLQSWIERLVGEGGTSPYCYKCVIAVKGMNRKFVFQGVNMIFTSGFEGKWKRNETRESRFVFIGKNLDKEFLQAGFNACRVTRGLRFLVGETVEVNVGTWEEGKVIKHWDEGHAYRVEVQNQTKQNVWAPVDTDEYIRKIQTD